MRPSWMTTSLLKLLGLLTLMGLVFLIAAPYLRGNEHWILSARDQGSGMIIRVRSSGEKDTAYTVVVQGYSLGRDIDPLVIDRDKLRFPEGMTLTFEDTSMLPGRCTVQIGPLKLDIMPAYATADGQMCDRGGLITVTVGKGSNGGKGARSQ